VTNVVILKNNNICNSLGSKETGKSLTALPGAEKNPIRHVDLASFVQKVDSIIHWINLYPVDDVISFPNTYPLDSDLSSG